MAKKNSAPLSEESDTAKSQSPKKKEFPLFLNLLVLGIILILAGFLYLMISNHNREEALLEEPAESEETEDEDIITEFPEGFLPETTPETTPEAPPENIPQPIESTPVPSTPTPPPGALDNLQAQLATRLEEFSQTYGGEWGLYVQNLTTGAECIIREESMPAASLSYLFIMGAAYENYTFLSETMGAEALKENIQKMISQGDAAAAEEILTALGRQDPNRGLETVNQFCNAHGYVSTNFTALPTSGNPAANTTSAADCGRFLAAAYLNSEVLPYPDAIFYHLRIQGQTSKIPSGIPEGGGLAANLPGKASGIENDAAVIYETPRNNYVFCILSQNVADTAGSVPGISELSTQIYGYFNQ